MINPIEIGSVKSVNPSRREVRIEVAKSYAPLLKDMVWLYVVLPGNEQLKNKVATIRKVGKRSAIVVLVPGVPRDNVARMLKAKVVVPDAELKRSVNDYDLSELEGLKVVSGNGTFVGRVAAVFETEAHGVLEVEVSGADPVLIPAVPELIERVDWERGEVVIGDIEPFLNIEDDDNPSALC